MPSRWRPVEHGEAAEIHVAANEASRLLRQAQARLQEQEAALQAREAAAAAREAALQQRHNLPSAGDAAAPAPNNEHGCVQAPQQEQAGLADAARQICRSAIEHAAEQEQ